MLLHGTVCSYFEVYMVLDAFLLRLPALAVLRGSILSILLVLSVLKYCSMWCPKFCAYWEFGQSSTEGPNTASTGSTISTEPRVQQAVPAVQTSEMDGVLKSIKSVEPVDISSARSIYSRNTASTLSTPVPPPKVICFNSHPWDHP